jgi:hypothetical protein
VRWLTRRNDRNVGKPMLTAVMEIFILARGSLC